MSLKNGKPNPLNFFEMRSVNFACPHFKFFTLNKFQPALLKNINDWIEYNLNGRYYIGRTIGLDSSNNIIYGIKIGFENEKEKIGRAHV